MTIYAFFFRHKKCSVNIAQGWGGDNYAENKITNLCSQCCGSRGVARIFQRGVTLCIVVMTFSPRNIVGCLLKNGLKSGGLILYLITKATVSDVFFRSWSLQITIFTKAERLQRASRFEMFFFSRNGECNSKKLADMPFICQSWPQRRRCLVIMTSW